VPFAVESYGAKGKPAQRLLLRLADASEELSAAAFLLHASAALSVALQCGNADIAAWGHAVAAHAAGGVVAARFVLRSPRAFRSTHRKHSLQPSGEYDDDDDLQVGLAFRWQMWLPKQQLYAFRPCFQLSCSLSTLFLVSS